jgi:transposase
MGRNRKVGATRTEVNTGSLNNASEQARRNSVVHRKVSGGVRSEWGADAHAVVTTMLDTARKRGADLLTTLHA